MNALNEFSKIEQKSQTLKVKQNISKRNSLYVAKQLRTVTVYYET